MYFKTTDNVIDKCIDAVDRFNYQHDVEVPLVIRHLGERKGSGYIEINRTQNNLQRIILNPDRFENIDHNLVYLYTTVHELGHAYDALNYHPTIEAYGNKFKKGTFQMECRAWEIGIGWALDNNIVDRFHYENIKKFMKTCLESYSKGKHNVTEVIEMIFKNIEGVI